MRNKNKILSLQLYKQIKRDRMLVRKIHFVQLMELGEVMLAKKGEAKDSAASA